MIIDLAKALGASLLLVGFLTALYLMADDKLHFPWKGFLAFWLGSAFVLSFPYRAQRQHAEWIQRNHVQACVDSTTHIKARKAWCSTEGWKHSHIPKHGGNPYAICIGDMVDAQRAWCETQVIEPHP